MTQLIIFLKMISCLCFDNSQNVKTLNVDLGICRVCYFVFQIVLGRQQGKRLGNIFLLVFENDFSFQVKQEFSIFLKLRLSM